MLPHMGNWLSTNGYGTGFNVQRSTVENKFMINFQYAFIILKYEKKACFFDRRFGVGDLGKGKTCIAFVISNIFSELVEIYRPEGGADPSHSISGGRITVLQLSLGRWQMYSEY